MQLANSHTEKKRTSGYILIALIGVLVLFSFFVTALTTDKAFRRGDSRLVQLFDSGVYLNTAQTILEINQKKDISLDGAKAEQKRLAEMLMLDGPVFPAVTARAIAAAESLKISELNALALLTSLLQAAVCGLIFILSWRATGNKTLSFLAGCFWSLYPPALIAAQRLGTETISALFLLTILLCFSIVKSSGDRGFITVISMFYAGVFFAFLLLTKPVLIFCILLPGAFLFLSLRRNTAFAGIIAFALATLVSMIPFWVFTKETTGTVCILPKRMPVLNAIVANNLINDGLGCLPTAPAADDIVAMKSAAQVEIALFLQNPPAHLDLNIRKMARLFAEPWNDFRRAAILPNPISIRYLHQLFGALSIPAIAAAFALLLNSLKSKRSDNKDSQNRGNDSVPIIFLALAGHLIYVAFEGIPRYGFTAMPLCTVLLAWFFGSKKNKRTAVIGLTITALFLTLLANLARVADVLQYTGNPTAVSIILAVSYFALISLLMYWLYKCASVSDKPLKAASALTLVCFSVITTLSLLREASSADLVAKLSSEAIATREIDMPAVKGAGNSDEKPSWALLLIDCEKEIARSHITFNGHEIHEIPSSVYHFYQRKFDLLAFLEELASVIKVAPEKVRQWRAVPIPIDFINFGGKNRISVSGVPEQPLTIYGDYLETPRGEAPSYEYLSHSRIFIDAKSLDWRPRVTFITQAPSRSFLTSKKSNQANDDLSSAPGIQNGRLRILLATGYSNEESLFKPAAATMQLGSFNFVTDAKKIALENSGEKPGQFLKLEKSCYADVALNAEKQATHAIIELKGRLAAESTAQAVIRVSLSGKENGSSGDLYLDSKGQPKPLSICFPSATQMVVLDGKQASAIGIKVVYPLDIVRGRADHLTVELMPLPAGKAVKLEDLNLSVRQVNWPDLSRGRVTVN
ncbi:MAG TPA: hypothetical protein PKZ32_01720 [Candidatus Melainabacteria bacterium]|nr:hypothetical protein [Candidatus Melainabacteria bacterium]